MARKVDIPSYRVSPHDVIDLATKVKDQSPHIINRETHGERDVPGWMVFPDRGRILIHQLPTREQIVIDVSEQLIVGALFEVSKIKCPKLVRKGLSWSKTRGCRRRRIRRCRTIK